MNYRLRRPSAFLFLSLLAAMGVCAFSEQAQAAPYLSSISGIVQRRNVGYQNWETVSSVPLNLAVGDSIRTGARAKATLTFEDGSRVEIGGNGSFTLENADARSSGVNLTLGVLKAFVQKLGSRRFSVRTPTAVCSVRGTEFQVQVLSGGRTVVDLYKGLLGVEDHKGQQILLHPNERIEVDARGMGTSAQTPTQSQIHKSQFHSVMRREMSLEMTKEQVQAAAAQEIKLSEYQLGKALTDVFGQRVRLEEYIVRPSANQFKLVVLNERASRFDYFYYLGTFNKNLPTDMSIALRQLPGRADTEPEYFLTGFETGRSNTKDSMVEIARDGHLVDVNHNVPSNDDVAFLYDGSKEKFEDVAGHNVYQSIFDTYGFYINGKLKYGWTGNNIQSYSDITASATTDPITGAALATALPARSVSTTFPSPGDVHQVIYESYSDGTYTKWDNYIISDEGKVVPFTDFQGGTSGVTYKQKVLNFNYQQVITASEFGGRKIDLVVEPRIFIQSGLIQ